MGHFSAMCCPVVRRDTQTSKSDQRGFEECVHFNSSYDAPCRRFRVTALTQPGHEPVTDARTAPAVGATSVGYLDAGKFRMKCQMPILRRPEEVMSNPAQPSDTGDVSVRVV